MRFFYFLILLIIVAAMIIFAVQNDGSVELKFINQQMSVPLSALIGGVYVLGMLSGWSVVGFLRRSIHEITDPRRQPQAQARQP